MAWSYSPTALDQPLNLVRLLVGDTQTDRQLLQDEEIAHVLSDHNDDPHDAAPDVAELIAAYYAGKADLATGSLRKSYQRQHDNYMSMAKRLKGKRMSGAVPVAGGLGKTYLGGTNDDYYNYPHNIKPPPDQDAGGSPNVPQELQMEEPPPGTEDNSDQEP